LRKVQAQSCFTFKILGQRIKKQVYTYKSSLANILRVCAVSGGCRTERRYIWYALDSNHTLLHSVPSGFWHHNEIWNSAGKYPHSLITYAEHVQQQKWTRQIIWNTESVWQIILFSLFL